MTHTSQKPVTVSSEHLPPSANSLFVNVKGKGRVKSERYREWLNAAGWDCNGKGSVHGPYAMTLIIGSHVRHKSADLDNFCKPCMDILVKHGIVDDDHLCEELSMRYGDLGAKAWTAIVTPVSWSSLP